MPKKTKSSAPWTGTKKDFIISMSDSLPNEIVDAAKARGLKLTVAHVYAVRSLANRRAREAKVARSAKPKPAVRAQQSRRSRPASRTPARPAAGAKRVAVAGSAGNLVTGLMAIGGRAMMMEIAEQLKSADKNTIDDLACQGMLRASAAMIGIPNAIKILENEYRTASQAILGALQ